jgi:GAF domain-containing protein
VLVPESVSEVYITSQLVGRVASRIDTAREKLAVQDIARQMANNPSQVLPTLVDLAIDLCGAVAGGISIYEKDGEVFRWHHLRGKLERFTGATTPRDYSPCGITLDHKSPVLVQKPERVYSWLVDADVSLPECLLVPLYVGEEEPLGTLWIVSENVDHFTDGHASTMQELAGFTGIALQMVRSEDRLKAALEEQELLTREMGHRVKNLFAIARRHDPTERKIVRQQGADGASAVRAPSCTGRRECPGPTDVQP